MITAKMELSKRITVVVIQQIFTTLFTLVIFHHAGTIVAFPLLPTQTKSTAKNIVNSFNQQTKLVGRNQGGTSHIAATDENQEILSVVENRRRFLSTVLSNSAAAWAIQPMIAHAESELPDQFNVDDYLKTGMVMNPMGVSGQAGKSKPVTGILLREGSEVSRDSRTGDVLAEILIQGSSANTVPVLASFVAPWPLASGTVFDVECRNPSTGDGAFLAVSSQVKSNAIQDIPDSFFVEQLIGPTGRFSSYGTPTDVKVRSSTTNGNYRIIDMSFSTLSQSTQTELPRRARIVATIPDGTRQAVMLVGSASLSRWNKSSKETILAVTDSFRAIQAPTSSLRLRAKERRS